MRNVAVHIVESLRKGIPPQQGIEMYSVGDEKLIEGIKRFHLSGIGDRGIIRFVSGSWGSGKTHFFRVLRGVSFEQGCLVSDVELNVSDAALNRFESVFFSIVRSVATPSYYAEEPSVDVAPFGRIARESLSYLSTGSHDPLAEISYEGFEKAKDALMADHGIDIDFKKMIQSYWETYLPDAGDPSTLQQTRDEIIQWFGGEGNATAYRKRFGINKMVKKDNAKLMLQSLAGFVRLSGYRGLVILFDEAEQAYSLMRRSALRDAQNNLLSLINNIEKIPGLFLVYATTPDFFNDPKHGIVTYGALAGRIGQPADRAPKALDLIWNLDAVSPDQDVYQEVAKKIRAIYLTAYPEAETTTPTDEDLSTLVESLYNQHPSLSPIRFWRVLMAALIARFDDSLEGETRPLEVIYDDVMDRLRED